MEQTVTQYQRKLFRTAIAILGVKADAEDIVQDVFIKLYEKQPQFASPEHEAAWLIRVTVNLSRNRLRSHWWRKTVPLLESYPAQTDEQQGLIEIISSLPSNQRTSIHLFYFEGYSVKEVAEMTGQKEAAVKKQLYRARQKLRNLIDEGDHSEKL
jgi:RNA polymerase sigma-70 factor (ECF subfamily)